MRYSQPECPLILASLYRPTRSNRMAIRVVRGRKRQYCLMSKSNKIAEWYIAEIATQYSVAITDAIPNVHGERKSFGLCKTTEELVPATFQICKTLRSPSPSADHVEKTMKKVGVDEEESRQSRDIQSIRNLRFFHPRQNLPLHLSGSWGRTTLGTRKGRAHTPTSCRNKSIVTLTITVTDISFEVVTLNNEFCCIITNLVAVS